MFILIEDGGRGAGSWRQQGEDVQWEPWVSHGVRHTGRNKDNVTRQCPVAGLASPLSLVAASPVTSASVSDKALQENEVPGPGKAPGRKGSRAGAIEGAAAPMARLGLSLPRPGFAAERRSETNHSKGFAALSSVFLPICKSGLGLSCCLSAPPEIRGVFFPI